MIKTLSPYYITIPFVSPATALTCTSFTLKIYIWNGSKSAAPTTATWERTEKNPTSSTSNIKINIARLVNDFIDFTQSAGTTTEIINGNNQQWVMWETIYNGETEPTNRNIELFGKGYSYGLEGENAPTPTNKILIPIIDYKVSRNSTFIVPIEVDETEGTSEIILNSVTLTASPNVWSCDFTINFAPANIVVQIFMGGVFVDHAILIGLTSPQEFYLEDDFFRTRLKAYDSTTGSFIYSNVISQ